VVDVADTHEPQNRPQGAYGAIHILVDILVPKVRYLSTRVRGASHKLVA
jgi:hypothetical protein